MDFYVDRQIVTLSILRDIEVDGEAVETISNVVEVLASFLLPK